MCSQEKSVGGNDRHRPLEASSCTRMRLREQGGGVGEGGRGGGGGGGGGAGKAEEAAKDEYANA